jgi:hypothetical protein
MNIYCPTPVHPSNASGITEVYVLSPGSTGLICAGYRSPTGGTYSFSTPDFGPLDGSSFQAFGPPGCANGPTPEPCRNISMTSIPSTIDHSGALNVKVACTISVGANAKGLYWPFVGSCGRLSPL